MTRESVARDSQTLKRAPDLKDLSLLNKQTKKTWRNQTLQLEETAKQAKAVMTTL